MKKYILMLLSAMLFACCSSDDKEPEVVGNQNISLSVEAVEFDEGGNAITGTNSVTVTSSAEWRLVGDTSWCTPSVEKGNDGTTVTFTVTANESEESRSANLVFICGDTAAKLAVRQGQNPVVEFIKIEDSYAIGTSGGDIVIKFNSNLESINSEISEDWISLLYSPENNDSSEKWLRFGVEPNETPYDREAIITLFKGTALEKKIAVEQYRLEQILIEDEADLEFDPDGGIATVKVVSNIDYSLSIGTTDAMWISIEEASSEGTYLVTKTYAVTCKPTGFSRTGSITLKSASGTSAKINVVQTNPNPELFDIPDNYFSDRLVSLGYMGGKDDKYYLTYSGYSATSLTANYLYYMESIEGIEKLESLTSFTAFSSSVKKMDFSKNTKLTTLTLTYNPIEVLILGDLNITTSSLNNALYNATVGIYAESFTISSSRLTTLSMNHVTSASYDKIEWIDVTGCPALTTLNCNRNSGNLKYIYVTQAQKNAIDAGTLKITTNANFSGEIVVK